MSTSTANFWESLVESLGWYYPKYRITIDCDGRVTTARLIVGGQTVKATKAVLSPDDKFSLPIGTRVAFERLWEKKPKDGDK